MARLIRRHEDQYVLITDDGQQFGMLNRPWKQKGFNSWHFYMIGRVDYKTFVTVNECVRWLETEQGFQVELIERK